MILLERDFGSLSPNRISFDLAIDPISLATQLRSSSVGFSDPSPSSAPLQCDEGEDRCAGGFADGEPIKCPRARRAQKPS